MTRSRWESRWLRPIALAELLLIFLMLPVSVLWYGLPCLWQDLPGAVRRAVKTLWTGRAGPYRGVYW